MKLFSLYSPANKARLLALGVVSICLIATVDFFVKNLPLGYLYFFPILLLSGFLDRRWIALVVLICAALAGTLSYYPLKPAIVLFVTAWAGFMGTGFFVSEVVRNRQKVLEHVQEMETQIRLRRETEEQLEGLVESSPLAILMIDANGNVLMANEAAGNLFTPDQSAIVGQPISRFLPALETVVQQSETRLFRTQIRCRGMRTNGDVFLAAVWFSTSTTAVGSILSAIVVDFSEDLRDREDLSLEHLLKNAKILLGAIAHEIRNLCGAVLVVYKNLSRVEGLQQNQDFQALGTLIEGLENLSTMELKPSWAQQLASVELSSVFDELRVVIEPDYTELNMNVVWKIQENLPLVTGDRYGLLQVFLNLARNSQRAMETSPVKRLTISSEVQAGLVLIRFEDTGIGIPDPTALFRAFDQSATASGLGLYVSRAILRSFQGDLRHEPRSVGCCFSVSLARFISSGGLC
jgi:two-component system, LuxR family, sensor kinase FixL